MTTPADDPLRLLTERIERLEQALSLAHLPYYDQQCHCCGSLHVPAYHDDSRCAVCVWSCHRGNGEYSRGQQCPTRREKKE